MQKEITMTITLQIDDESKSAKTSFTAKEGGKKKPFYSFTDTLLMSRALVMYSGKMLNNCSQTLKDFDKNERH